MDTETDIETSSTEVPIACNLTNEEGTKQALEWVELQHRSSEVAAIEGGVRMTLPASLADQVADLGRREAGCCAFLTIETSVIGDALTLDISSPNPDAIAVISALAGIPLP